MSAGITAVNKTKRWQVCRKAKTLLASFSFIFFSSCASAPETKYYFLAKPLRGESPASTLSTAAGQSSVAPVTVRQVVLPSYLKDSGIVLATPSYQLRRASHNRWAEPLEEGIRRFLRDYLMRELGQRRSLGTKQAENDMLVDLVISYFHGNTEGLVTLETDWRAENGCGSTGIERFQQQMLQEDDGYEALVATHARLLESLSKTMLASITTSCR